MLIADFFQQINVLINLSFIAIFEKGLTVVAHHTDKRFGALNAQHEVVIITLSEQRQQGIRDLIRQSSRSNK